MANLHVAADAVPQLTSISPDFNRLAVGNQLALSRSALHLYGRERRMADLNEVGKGWLELCAAASQEPDSEKLGSLVNQIIEALDARNQPSSLACSDDSSR